MEVRYAEHLGLRVELEQVVLNERGWWRARVTRGPEGPPAAPFPWSYAPAGDQALADAVQMWTRVTLAATAAARTRPPTGTAARRERTAAQPEPPVAPDPELPPALARKRVVVTMRCDECEGEGSVPLGPETARRRRCPVCQGAGTLTAKLSFAEFRALRARWGF